MVRIVPDKVIILYPVVRDRMARRAVPGEPSTRGGQRPALSGGEHLLWRRRLCVGAFRSSNGGSNRPAPGLRPGVSGGERGFIAQSDAPNEPKPSVAISISEAQEIASRLRSGDDASMKMTLDALFGRLESEGCSAADLTFVYAELIHILLQVSRENGLEKLSDDIPALECLSGSTSRAWFFEF
jgi:hypothetical protein